MSPAFISVLKISILLTSFTLIRVRISRLVEELLEIARHLCPLMARVSRYRKRALIVILLHCVHHFFIESRDFPPKFLLKSQKLHVAKQGPVLHDYNLLLSLIL